MKKLLLVSAAIALSASSFAQSSILPNSGTTNPYHHNNTERTSEASVINKHQSSYAKSSGLSDTVARASQAQLDSLFNAGSKLYYLGATAPFDSGFIFGPNPLGFTGFADWFRGQYQPDTTLKILGVLARFGGTYQPGTTKTISLKIWGVDTTSVLVSGNLKVRDLPSTTVMGTITKTISNLGIGNVITAPDTPKIHYFTTAISNVNTNFYAGYEANFPWTPTNGDTLGAYSTGIGSGWGSGVYYVNTPDTIVFAQTVIQAAGTWKDALVSYGLDPINVSIVPVFQWSGANFWPSEVGGLTKNNLTFWGHYPNPTTDKVNIKFSLDKSTSVTVNIMDVTGKTVATIPSATYSTGEHIIGFSTHQLAAGNYVYMISTAQGDAMAAQITVAK